MEDKDKIIAIIGGGPSGCTLAYLLHQAGFRVKIFDQGNRPELLIGESLIPGVIPILRRLNLEEKVSKIGRKKPGALIHLLDGVTWALPFSVLANEEADYAYNVNRKEFDQLFINLAKDAGVQFCYERVIAKEIEGTLSLFNSKKEPLEADLIIDCSGRNRLLSKALGVEAALGDRDDIALFAHLEPFEELNDGLIHLDIFKYGWFWRIPLPDATSVGVVVVKEYLNQYGSSREIQYDNLLQKDPILKSLINERKRISQVKQYSNYQLTSLKLFGSNWVLAGDAAGFIDPAFSSGLFLALRSATLLADLIIEQGFKDTSLKDYSRHMNLEYDLWGELVNSFYDGRFFGMFRLNSTIKDPTKFKKYDLNLVVAKIISGYGHLDWKNKDLFSLLIRFAASARDVSQDRILPQCLESNQA